MQVARDGGSQGTAVGGTPRGRLGASRCSFYALPGPLLSRAHKSTLGFSRSIFLSGCQFTTRCRRWRKMEAAIAANLQNYVSCRSIPDFRPTGITRNRCRDCSRYRGNGCRLPKQNHWLSPPPKSAMTHTQKNIGRTLHYPDIF